MTALSIRAMRWHDAADADMTRAEGEAPAAMSKRS